jgi:predicted transcriptional regulator
LDLCRELASKEQTRTALAEKYGVSQPAISQFAKRHAQRIEEIRANLDDEFAGLWIAKKRNRITAYQADVELIDTKAQKDGATMADADMIRVKTTIMKAVAEELGQLPARVTVTVTPVEHIFMGVPMDELK